MQPSAHAHMSGAPSFRSFIAKGWETTNLNIGRVSVRHKACLLVPHLSIPGHGLTPMPTPHSPLPGSLSTNGTQNRNVAPCPGTLSAVIPPSCAARIARAIANPIPDPLPRFAPFFPR